MKSFLDEVAKEIIDSGHSLKAIKIIVPSKRATIFLKNSLSNQINRPAFAPVSYTHLTLPTNREV